MEMTDYKTMYLILVDGICKSVEVLASGFLQTEEMLKSHEILMAAMERAEDVYMAACGAPKREERNP